MDKINMVIARIIYEISTSWLIILLYLIIIFLLLDIGRICHFIPSRLLHSSIPGSLAIFILMAGLLFIGNVRYNHKQKREISIKTKKFKDSNKIVFVSDLHIGYHTPRSELHRWLDIIEAEKPDMMLIAGDIIDGNLRPLEEEQAWEEFQHFPIPIYACLGNHEYLAGKNRSIDFFHKSGIKLLVDSTSVTNDICILGRDDRTNPNRKSLKELMQENNSSKFTILLDHQPFNLEEASLQNVDLQLSGHTHHGQVWPLNWVTDAVYECSYGYYKKGETEYYISSGLGIWGGKFRIGTSSEYVVIEIN